ncbi:hypothetical protein KFE98_07415 [bacterium SCSIO 12741]|nr:hypothetical protein KFE98_07415 [bacterium SCSIO 12741]
MNAFLNETAYTLRIGLMHNGNSWTPAPGSPNPSFGNSTADPNGPRPRVALFYEDGAILEATIYNGTDNPDFTGNFNETPNHAPGTAVVVPIPDGQSLDQIIASHSCFVLNVGATGNGNSWKPVGPAPAPPMGNGSNGTNPDVYLMYPDGDILLATVFNGTNNGAGIGNFNSTPNHAPSDNVMCVLSA